MNLRDLFFLVTGAAAMGVFLLAITYRQVKRERKKLRRTWNSLPISKHLDINDIIKN